MATLITDAERNAAADRDAAAITHLSLHTATTGITGAAEAIGGTPACARKPPTFNAGGAVGPLGGTLQPATVGCAWSSEVIFDVPAGTYSYWGSWGTGPAGASLGTVTIAITTGVLTVSAVHGLVVGDAVQLGTMTNGAPLVAGTTYYVASVPTTTTLTLSATPGGAAIVTTSAGSSTSIVKLTVFKRGNTVNVSGVPTPQVLSSQGQIKLSVGVGPVAGA
jgi:hypothetical protein